MVVSYKHEPFTDFTVEENRRAMEEAIEYVTRQLGETYPLIIDGERIMTEEKIISVNSANREEVVGFVAKSNKQLAERAMQVADHTFETWRSSDPKYRADILCNAVA